ncbi:hypothetical protein [Streptomyces sp. NPDC058867]|uniref:hypothetical protein n=1 Tax=unclassified Streptomyces TaxID=2593676 RepID=UPI00367A8116
MALPHVLPLAVRLLAGEPLLDACFHAGDLLLAAVDAPAAVWELLPDVEARLREVVRVLTPEEVAELPRGAAEQVARFAARP